jgi:hypothetical protein
VAVLGLELLGELDHAGHRAVDLDRQAGRLGLVEREALVGEIPPARDLRRLVDAAQLRLVFRCQRPQDHGHMLKERVLRPRT